MSEAPSPSAAPSPTAAPDPTASPAPTSPSADAGAPPAADPSPAAEPAPAGQDTATAPSGEDTGTAPEADDKLNVVPEDGKYELAFSDEAKAALGNLDGDPVMAALMEDAKEQGLTQAQFNERVGGIVESLAKRGLLAPSFDPAAETAKLSEGGQDGKARQEEVQVYADSLKARGDIDDEEYGELMSLMPTAAGVRLVEKLRKFATGGEGAGPGGGDPVAETERLKAEASEMRRDPKYDTDPTFRAQADKKFKQAWGIK